MNQGPKKSTGHTGRDSKFVDDISGPYTKVKFSGNVVSTQSNAGCIKLSEVYINHFLYKYFCKKRGKSY